VDSVSVVESEKRTGEPRYISSQVIGTTLHGSVTGHTFQGIQFVACKGCVSN